MKKIKEHVPKSVENFRILQMKGDIPVKILKASTKVHPFQIIWLISEMQAVMI